MKKFLACILICSMSFGMTGCSVLEKVGLKKEDKKVETTEKSTKKSSKTSEKASIKTSEKAGKKTSEKANVKTSEKVSDKTSEKATEKATQKAGTPEEQIEAYIKQGVDSGQIQKLVNSYGEKGIALEVNAKGEAMVYKSMFIEDVPENAAQIIEAQVTAAAPSLRISAEEVKKDEPAIKTVTYEFYDKNSKLLYTIDF